MLRTMAAQPTFREALFFWLKLGFISFGGPAGQIAIMQHELVEKKQWITQERLLYALNFCMLLPGPEAQQLAIYCGWLLHGTRGGIVAGVLFVLPSAVMLWGLSIVYVIWGAVPAIAGIFYGLKPAVIAVVAAAVLRLGKKALKNGVGWGIAAAAFALICIWHTPFPAIVAGAAAVGIIGGKLWPELFGVGWNTLPPTRLGDTNISARSKEPICFTWVSSVKVIGVCGVLWGAPILVAGCWQGWDGVLIHEGMFFSKAAMVTFGGAYAVLPYVGQQAVEHFHWLTSTQMLDGLAFAETTPGPLIIVLQFVGFLGGWNQPGTLSPLLAATLGAAMTTWTTFVPCFLWIFLGAPHLERLRGVRLLNAALGAVTTAVVGGVLNLAGWFGLHTLRPDAATGAVDWFATALAVAAFVALHRFKFNLIAVIAACGVLGLAGRLW